MPETAMCASYSAAHICGCLFNDNKKTVTSCFIYFSKHF